MSEKRWGFDSLFEVPPLDEESQRAYSERLGKAKKGAACALLCMDIFTCL